MAFPKLLQKLFGNSGAGPLLRSDILPAATATTPGAVKIGSGINVSDDGTISAATRHIYPYEASYANQNPKQGEVCVIRGSTDVSPSNEELDAVKIEFNNLDFSK